ncbi:hypothetical protein RKD28_006465 [Streptomyces sp. SAI-229]|jgi:hypothetical protein
MTRATIPPKSAYPDKGYGRQPVAADGVLRAFAASDTASAPAHGLRMLTHGPSRRATDRSAGGAR